MIPMDIFINAEDCIAGRLASIVAKELLKGNRVYIVNAEKAVISGDPDHNIRMMKEKTERGDPYHGPFYPRKPDQVIKRFVRGMLPKKPRGRDALKNLKVFLSVPPELDGKEFSRPEGAHNKLAGKYMELGRLAERVGTKKTW
jgi:large subunit ribosomal protein L13